MSNSGGTCLETIEFVAAPRPALTLSVGSHLCHDDDAETSDLTTYEHARAQASTAVDWVVDTPLDSFWTAEWEARPLPRAVTFSCSPSVEVDLAACDSLARFLRTQRVPPAREEIDISWLDRNQVGNFFCFLVAICHQTSPRGRQPLEGFVGGQRLRGWDYMLAKFGEMVRQHMEWLAPKRWSRIQPAELRRLFRDATLGDRLSDIEGRAVLLRDLGRGLEARRWGHLDDLYAHCDGRITIGWPNLLNELSQFLAYQDPVRKKSYFFLSLMETCDRWRYVDRESLGSPVDYHEVRGHLRIGTVKVVSDRLRTRLLHEYSVDSEEDIAIRRAVHEAIMIVAERSGIRDPLRLHYLFWNVFRSICTRERPKCLGPIQESDLPPRYLSLTRQPDGTRRCPFSAFCQSCAAISPIVEHVHDTDYY